MLSSNQMISNNAIDSRLELEEKVWSALQINITSCDVLLSLFWSSLKTYRRSSVCSPLPPFFRDQKEPYDEIEALLKQIPPVKSISKKTLKQFSLETLSLLYWIIVPKRFTMQEISSREYEHSLHTYPNVIAHHNQPNHYKNKPVHIFQIHYKNNESFARLEATSTQPLLYGFHGSPLPNWHSILHYRLNSKFSKETSIFGQGIYFAFDQRVAENFVEFGGLPSGYSSSLFEHPHTRLACIAGCEIVPDSNQVKFVGTENTQTRINHHNNDNNNHRHQLSTNTNNKSYMVVTNDDRVRITHLLVYSHVTSSSSQRSSVSFFAWNKGYLLLAFYLLFLCALPFLKSSSIKKWLKI